MVRADANESVSASARVSDHAYQNASMQVCTCVCVCGYVCMYLHIYIYTLLLSYRWVCRCVCICICDGSVFRSVHCFHRVKAAFLENAFENLLIRVVVLGASQLGPLAAFKRVVFGTRDLKYWILGTSGRVIEKTEIQKMRRIKGHSRSEGCRLVWPLRNATI